MYSWTRTFWSGSRSSRSLVMKIPACIPTRGTGRTDGAWRP